MSTEIASPETETKEHGMSLEEAIREYVRIDARYAELSREKKRCLEVLLTEAQGARGTANTARLKSYDDKIEIKVQYGNDFKCDPNPLNEAKELLGDDKFEELFKTEYTARLKTLKPFLTTKSTDERIETAKEKIKEGVRVVPKYPYVTIERGREIV